MASSKRPTYIVETKLATERKRRKSDLVIMWQSIWDVTSIIVQELWMTVLRMWELMQLWFSSSERFEVQSWLERYLPFVPDNFSDSWRDGRLLAILLNRLHPGCLPEADQLDPDCGLKNVYKAFDVLEVYFGIKPDVSVEEIVTCLNGSEAKLFKIILELKHITENQPENGNCPVVEAKENAEQSSVTQGCIAKGTGLVVGFVGRCTNFIIFCAFMSDLDVIIEIRGPNTACSERITRRSPKKKSSMSSWEFVNPLADSMDIERNILITQENEKLKRNIISLEYEIIGNQISVSYRPKEKGQHKVSILWHGQNVPDSPFFVTVEDPAETKGTNSFIFPKSALKSTHETDKNYLRKHSVRFQESQVRYKDQPSILGRVVKKRILRYIVKINGKDVPVNVASTDSLASELIKMEYDIQMSQSPHRRNSWGFAGDAERKKSVIRQFGIDIKELEDQISLRRTRSMSVNPRTKKLLEKSDSAGDLTPRLNIVSEDFYESNEKIHENEADYAYLTECATTEENGTKVKEEVAMQENRESEEGETLGVSNELMEITSVENQSDDIEIGGISSLSPEVTLPIKGDNLREDFHANNLSCDETPKSDESDIETMAKMSFSCEDSIEKSRSSATSDVALDHLKMLISRKKSRKKLLTVKKWGINKKYVKTKKTNKSTKENFNKKSFRNTNSFEVSSDVDLKNRKIIKKGKNETNAKVPSSQNLVNNSAYLKSTCLRNPPTQDDADNSTADSQHHFNGNLDRLNNFSKTNKLTHSLNYPINPLPAEELITKKFNEPKISLSHHNFNNIANSEGSLDEDKKPKWEINEPEIKKIQVNRSLSGKSSSVESDINSRTENQKIFRTHTLRTLEQFNFKQFCPSDDSQDRISPVKSQIEQWECTLSSENQKLPMRKASASEIEQVSVREKLAFWENACKTEQKAFGTGASESQIKANLAGNKKFQGSIKTMKNDLQNPGSTDKNPSKLDMQEISEVMNSINKETDVAAKKDVDDKIITRELTVNSSKIRRRSFSDPGVSETATNQTDNLSSFPSLESSTRDCPSLSHDDNLNEYFSDDSGGDYVHHSTEDEYIDDEISGTASEYWGDLGILKVARSSIDDSEQADEFLRTHQQLKSFPNACKVFGIAVYYGHVAVKNRFQVYSGDAGCGYLTVGMQGLRRHDVTLVSVAYARNDVYEVTYQVMTPGYYLISVRWMDSDVPGSPFVCKVTF